MAKDNDILRDAIIGTEKEIAASAFDKEEGPLDGSGDRSLEALGDGLEGQHEPEDDDDAENPDERDDDDPHPSEEPENPDEVAAKDAEPKPVVETQPDLKGRVPAGRLREESERARAAIAERDTFKAQLDAEKVASQKAVADLNAKFDALLALQRQPAPKPGETTQPAAPKIPDLFEDPNAFAEHLNKGVQERFDNFLRQQRDQQVNASIESARKAHGQTFEDAFGALKGLDYKNPENVQLVKRMEASANPGETIVSWHKRNVAAREVGDDLDGFKARIAEETRKQLMADPEFRKELVGSLRGDAAVGDQGQPRTAVRIPRSLSQTAGSNSRTPDDLEIYDGSESAIARLAWST
jgi:hypothetical protein